MRACPPGCARHLTRKAGSGAGAAPATTLMSAAVAGWAGGRACRAAAGSRARPRQAHRAPCGHPSRPTPKPAACQTPALAHAANVTAHIRKSMKASTPAVASLSTNGASRVAKSVEQARWHAPELRRLGEGATGIARPVRFSAGNSVTKGLMRQPKRDPEGIP